MFKYNNIPTAYKAIWIIHIYWNSVSKNIQKKITGSTGLNFSTKLCKNALVQFMQLVSGQRRCRDSTCPSDVSLCTIQTVFVIMWNGV